VIELVEFLCNLCPFRADYAFQYYNFFNDVLLIGERLLRVHAICVQVGPPHQGAISVKKPSSSSNRKSRRRDRSTFLESIFGPRLEPMESRTLLSATILDGQLTIDGTTGNDAITVVAGGALGEVVVNGPGIGADTLFSDVTGIVINGLAGDDTITVGANIKNTSNRNIAVEINGGDDDDTIAGGSGSDIIDGGAGNDTIDYSAATKGVDVRLDRNEARRDGLGGKDTLNNIENVIGSNFNDSIRGDANDNIITGGDGNDRLRGQGGDDTLNGGEGNDNIDDAEGDNTIHAGEGNNKISTGEGNDNITAGSGNDSIKDKGGDNTIDAGDGDNKVTTGDGDDNINTGSGRDSISSKDGDDDISTGAGNDRIKSGDGDDTIESGDDDDTIDSGDDDDDIDGGQGDDKIKAGNGFDSISGGSGNDRIDGGRDDDSIDGGEDDDDINGGDGDDDIDGGEGDDDIDGGNDDDDINGGDGDDDIDGGDDDDDINGGDGDDDIDGGAGDDDIDGGNDDDDIEGGEGDDDIDGGEGDDDVDGDVEDDDDGEDEDDDENDPTSGPNAGATTIDFDGDGNATLTGTSLNKEDRDIFKFTALTDGVLTVTAQTTNDNMPKVEVESSGEDEQEAETEPHHGVNSFQLALVEGRTYFLKIKSSNTSPSQYSVSVSVGEGTIESGGGNIDDAPAAPSDVFNEVEPNDLRANALDFAFPVANLVRITGTSLSSTDKDFFRFTATANGTLSAHLFTGDGQQANVEIESLINDDDSLEIEQSDGQNQASMQIVAGVSYSIRVRSETSGPADYLLDLSIA